MDRRRALRRQPPRRRRHPHARRHRDRPALDPLADRGLLLARATTSPRRSRRSTGSSTSTTAWTTSAPGARPSSTPIHEQVGHLGIFVSAGVAKKEHDEFASNIDLIDVLPPGLYEAVLTPKGEAVDNPDLVTGEWVMRCEARTLDDIRALGGNDLADERKFAAAARLSEINLALYRTFAAARGARHGHAADGRGDAPDAPAAALLRDVRPAQPVAGLGRRRGRARPRDAASRVAADNPLLAAQAALSQQIVDGLRGLSAQASSGCPRTPSTPSTARRRCRPRSASTRPRPAAAQGGAERAARGAGGAPHRASSRPP